MTHSISNVYQAESLQAPWPAEHVSPRVTRVALVTDGLALSNAPGCQKTDCIPKFLARHPLPEDHRMLRCGYFAFLSPFLFSIISIDESKLERRRYHE